MKKLIYLISAFASLNIYANDCDFYFEHGTNHYNRGVNDANWGVEHFNVAVSESQNANPDMNLICSKLSNSANMFRSAERYYVQCYDSFAKAKEACSGENYRIASDNQMTCYNLETQERTNREMVEENYRKICL